MNLTELSQKLPRYRCIKCVSAAKITTLKTWPDGVLDVDLVLPDGKEIQARLPANWNHKHAPERGGYIVFYDDNYISYSPAEAFEQGYIELTEGSET